MNVSDQDRRRVARFLDGEMPGTERAVFQARLAEDEDLRAAVREAEELRQWFEGVRTEPGLPIPPGFRDRVLARVRRLPLVDVEEKAELERRAGSLARGLLVAAALIFSLATLVAVGLLRRPDTGRLRADPVLEQELQRLDRAILEAEDKGAEDKR